MKHVLFAEEQNQYPIAILIKESALSKSRLDEHYVWPLEQRGINKGDIVGFSLDYGSHKKAPVKHQKAYLDKLLPALKSLGTHALMVADGDYFKTLTGERKAEPHHGSIKPCKLTGFEDLSIILAPNYAGLFYNPALQDKIDMALDTLAQHVQGTHRELGSDIIHSAAYPREYLEIEQALNALHQYPELSCDIEGFSLQFWKAGIGTIGFAWDEHNGVSFPVDYLTREQAEPMLDVIGADWENPSLHGFQGFNEPVRKLLRRFFETYRGKFNWHNVGYDAKVLVFQLFMDHPLDEVGKQKGIEFFTRNFDDTKLITYLATNSCAGNKLSLKDQAHEFAGNYAQDEIEDIRRIPLDQLLKYNLIDCLSTWYVKKKHLPTMIQDQQEPVYTTIFKPSVKVILQMELTGMPISMEKVAEARAVLEQEIRECLQILRVSPIIRRAQNLFTELAWKKDYEDRKAKAKHPDKIKPKDWETFKTVEFNPNSTPQLQGLLYGLLNLPVLDLTDTKQPATGGKTLKKLRHHTQDAGILKLLETLVRFTDADKILGTFIKAFEENSFQKPDGHWYLHGSFNLGGTVSGRLSSSGPNLQNIPANSKWAKLIKACFVAPPGWLFCGADFASLEDRISALTTKDPNKLKVYTQGFDGHCLRAFYYFGEKMPDIVETVQSINSIADKYPDDRQDSKAPTFALTYQGTAYTLMNNLGWPEAKAKAVEAAYHAMYVVSDQWVQGKLDQASKDGYVTVAFGLRVRTPLLQQCLMGSKRTPYEAKAEGRTAGNALGQSYGLLNNRAGIQFQEETWASQYRYDILPVSQIHDAGYFLIRNDIDIVQWANNHLCEAMKWQELPEIQHDEVKLGGELDLFYPSWAEKHTLPNNASIDQIHEACMPKAEKAA